MLAASAIAAEPPWKPWLLRRWLPPAEAEGMMRRFVDQHLRPVALPKSRDEWLGRRDRLRRDVLGMLGIDDLVPPKWDLKIRPKGTIRRDGYRIEKLTFESYPGMAVPALVYVPEGLRGPAPGIVSIAGHVYGLGKAADFLQQRNVNLVRRGCVVLAYDYLDTGERNTGEDPLHGKPYGGGNDHGLRSFSFSRRTPTGLEVLDAMRALDVLEARPEVDRARLGFTGESGGGNSTYWIAALDPRVKLAVPVSSVTTFDYWIDRDVNWDWHQRPFGIRRLADIGTLLALHAPEPLVVISSRRGTDDQEFPLDEANKAVAWAEPVYRLLGAPGAILHIESSTAHGYQQDKRERLYEAVERWLAPPRPQGPQELPAAVESFEQLRCGLPPENRTHQDVYAEWLRALPRAGAGLSPGEAAELREFLRDRSGFPQPMPDVRAAAGEELQADRWRARAWLVEPEPGIRLPGLFIQDSTRPADGANGSPISLVLGRDETLVARALAEGKAVFAFDVRGSGEIPDGGGRARNWAWFFGRPMAGQQAFDVVQVARWLRGEYPGAALEVHAPPRLAWAAAFAGAAEPELLAGGSVSLPVASLHEYVRQQGHAALCDVPGLLERIDVPQLRQLRPGGMILVPGRPTVVR
ncbi:MAG: acetylxylan esterase [Thermoguttaceae bacterium]|nr:acetylxylan esterase [Thermoguttaceae bacterium]